MSLNDLFRSFFGFDGRQRPSSGNHQGPFDNYRQDEDEDDEFYGDDDDDDGHHQNIGIFGHFPHFDFKFHGDTEFDQIFRQFDEMFRNFGVADFPAFSIERPEMPAIDQPPSQGSESPRDNMLKDPDSEDKRGQQHRIEIIPPNFKHDSDIGAGSHRPFFEGFWSSPTWSSIRDEDKEDKDLDNEATKENLDKIFADPREGLVKPRERPATGGFFKSFTVQTIRRPDGTVEERRTVRNQDGTEETITKSAGDKSYTKKIIKNKEGEEENIETFRNMDEKDLPEFNKSWNAGTSGGQNVNQPRDRLIQDYQDPESHNIFKRFFGFTPPNFRDS